MDVNDVLGTYNKDIFKEIEKHLSTITPDSLQEASLYLTKAGGKMLRPSLAIMTAEAVGGSKQNAIGTAGAIELIHTFSLIHDDIMDDDDMRRGEPSVHKVWDEGIAILAGDTLFSKAFEIIINTPQEDVSAAQLNAALATVADACVKICEGQASDISFEGRYDVGFDEYMEMIFKKTSALIAAATKAGAIVGGGSDEVVDAMYEYGRLIGLAFQIQDDYLDLVSTEDELGKPVGSDIVEGKMTIIVIKALEEASPKDKETLLKILKGEETSQADVNVAMDLLDKYGALEYARNVAQENVEEAMKLLEILPDSESKQALELIADFVLERKS